MSNVIRFLEKIGSTAQWNDLTMDQMELALAETDLDDRLRSAILNSDLAQLQQLLQQQSHVVIIIPGTEEEEDEEPDGEDAPGEDDAHRAASSLIARA